MYVTWQIERKYTNAILMSYWSESIILNYFCKEYAKIKVIGRKPLSENKTGDGGSPTTPPTHRLIPNIVR